MFGLGFWEIILILLVAVIFLRPDDLPIFLRKLGKLYKRLMDVYRDMTRMINEPVDMISDESSEGGEGTSADDASSKKGPAGGGPKSKE